MTPANVGTAYVEVKGDLSTVQKQVGAFFGGAKMKGLGRGAGAAAGVGLAAGLGAALGGKLLFDLGDRFDAEFDKIRTGTGATGEELRHLRDDFKDVLKTVPSDFATVGDAITEVNKRLNLTGRPLENLTRQFVQLSKITGTDVNANIRAVARAFVDWEVPTRRQGAALDGLFRLSQRTGIGVADLADSVQRFGSPLRQLGFTLDEAAATFAQFEKAGVNTQTMVPGLKLAIANLTRPTASLGATMDQLGISAGKPEQALRQVFRLLGDNSTLSRVDKIGLAMDVFGKRAGADMAEAIKQGRFEVDDLIKTMRGGRDTISKAEKDTRDFGEQWQLLKNRVFVGIEPVASKFFDSVGDGMERLATADFGQIGADIGFDKIDLSGVEADVSAASKSIRSILQSDLVQFLGSTVLGAFKRTFEGIGAVVRAGVKNIATILKILDDIVHLRFGRAFGRLDDLVKGGFQSAVAIMRTFSAPMREIAARIGAGLAGAFRSAWRTVRGIFSDGVSGALGVLRRTIAKAVDLGESIGRGIGRGVQAGLKGLGKAVRAAGQAVLSALRSVFANKTIIPGFKVKGPGPLPDINFPGVKTPAFAKGGTVRKQQMALVGEEGPELVKLPEGSRVYPHGESKRMAKRMGIPAFARGGVVGSRTAPDKPADARIASTGGLNAAVQYLAKIMREQFGLRISSGVRPADSGSFHSVGKAADFVGARMREAAAYVKTSGLYKTLLEGIHNPNLSTDSGKLVSPGFWGAETWAGHRDHVHLAAATIREAVKRNLDGTGGARPRRPHTFEKLSLGQYVTVAKRAGFPDPALAAAIFYAESRGDVDAVGDHGTSFGASQIHWPDHKDLARKLGYSQEEVQQDIFKNFKMALRISGGGKNFKPWTQFKNGAYKRFLGAKAKALPKTGAAPTGASLADYWAFWLDEAKDTPGTKDDRKWINKLMRYWRGVLRRNRSSNPKRAQEALGNIRDLREQKKALNPEIDEEAFTLGDLTYIGKDVLVPPGRRFPGSGPPPSKDYTWDGRRWTKGAVFTQRKVNIGGIQRTLDRIGLDIARAALTETFDANGKVTPGSFADDIKAATDFVNVWAGIKQLADAQGTIKQQTEAATNLRSALDAQKSIQDDMKEETGSTETADKRDLSGVFAEIAQILKDYAPNFRKLPSQTVPAFAEGGVSGRTQMALVGERGPELVKLPQGARVYSHEESKRLTRDLGIPAFAEGGVVRPVSTASSDSYVRLEPKQMETLIRALHEQRPNVTKNVDARSTFREQPADPHRWSRSVAFELEAA